MGTTKVTFYNNDPLTVNNIQSSDESGIYFQPSNDISKNKLPAHIVHHGHFYTYGSYVIDDIQNDNSLNYLTDYVVTNIISDQYAKTLTVKKQKLNLSELQTKIDNYATYFDTLCGSSASLQLGNDYYITIRTVDGKFHLSSDTILTPTCELKLNNSSNHNSYTLSSHTAKLQITNISENAKVKEITISNSKGVHNSLFTISNNTITIPNNLGNYWDDEKDDSVEFTITVKLTKANDNITNVGDNTKTFKCRISKATPIVEHYDLYNLTDARISNGNGINTYTMCKPIKPTDPTITYTISNDSNYFEIVNNSFKFNSRTTTYNFNERNNTFKITYTINTSDDDIYCSNISGTINGSVAPSKWSVKFNANGGKIGNSTEMTKYAYYDDTIDTIYPTNPTKDADGNTTYTFKGWYTSASNNVSCNNLKIGDGSKLTWTEHSTTVYAQWNSTTKVNYYWYVGQENPASIDTSNLKTATNEAGWHLIGTSTSGFTLTFNNQNLIEFEDEGKYYLIIPTSLNVYAADGSTSLEGKSLLPIECKISNHKAYEYYTSVYEVKGLVIK